MGKIKNLINLIKTSAKAQIITGVVAVGVVGVGVTTGVLVHNYNEDRLVSKYTGNYENLLDSLVQFIPCDEVDSINQSIYSMGSLIEGLDKALLDDTINVIKDSIKAEYDRQKLYISDRFNLTKDFDSSKLDDKQKKILEDRLSELSEYIELDYFAKADGCLDTIFNLFKSVGQTKEDIKPVAKEDDSKNSSDDSSSETDVVADNSSQDDGVSQSGSSNVVSGNSGSASSNSNSSSSNTGSTNSGGNSNGNTTPTTPYLPLNRNLHQSLLILYILDLIIQVVTA